jgi:hypothetical protein
MWSPPLVAATGSRPAVTETRVAAIAERPYQEATEHERRRREAVTISTSLAPPRLLLLSDTLGHDELDEGHRHAVHLAGATG